MILLFIEKIIIDNLHRYSWGFSDSIENEVTGLGAMDHNIIIYKSQLNPLFMDASIATGKIMQDTSSIYFLI